MSRPWPTTTGVRGAEGSMSRARSMSSKLTCVMGVDRRLSTQRHMDRRRHRHAPRHTHTCRQTDTDRHRYRKTNTHTAIHKDAAVSMSACQHVISQCLQDTLYAPSSVPTPPLPLRPLHQHPTLPPRPLHPSRGGGRRHFRCGPSRRRRGASGVDITFDLALGFQKLSFRSVVELLLCADFEVESWVVALQVAHELLLRHRHTRAFFQESVQGLGLGVKG